MYESQQKIPIVNLRVVANVIAYLKSNVVTGVAHTGVGEYTITLSEGVDYEEMNIRCCLFGDPVAPD